MNNKAFTDISCQVLYTDFYTTLRRSIISSSQNIFVWCYVFNFHFYRKWHRSSHIFFDILSAANRKVDVRFILDSSRRSSPNHKANFFTYKRLSEHGIEVNMPNHSLPQHSKIITIDNKVTFVGSHNFTDSSLENPFETSIFFDSYEISDYFYRSFLELWGSTLTVPWVRK